MSTWKAVVTEKGDALLAKLTQGSTMEIAYAEIGAGKVDSSLLKQQTSVSTVKGTATVEPVGYPEEGMCALPVTITNEGVGAGYAAWQIGVFANDPDEGKILFFIAQAEDTATTIPSAALNPSYKTQIIFHVEYGAADSVSVSVIPANTVSQAGMENYVAAQIAGVTPEALGLGNVDNTSDNEKYVAYATRAGSADKAKNALTIHANSGRTENTNQWTYDGSVAKAVNITPEKIGAAKANEVSPAIESAEYPGHYYRVVSGVTEWLNPPLVPGVEYVTTERYSGSRIHRAYIVANFGAMDGTAGYADYTIDHGLTFTRCVRAFVISGDNYVLPYLNGNMSISVKKIAGDGITIRCCNTTWSATTFHMILDYIK